MYVFCHPEGWNNNNSNDSSDIEDFIRLKNIHPSRVYVEKKLIVMTQSLYPLSHFYFCNPILVKSTSISPKGPCSLASSCVHLLLFRSLLLGLSQCLINQSFLMLEFHETNYVPSLLTITLYRQAVVLKTGV